MRLSDRRGRRFLLQWYFGMLFAESTLAAFLSVTRGDAFCVAVECFRHARLRELFADNRGRSKQFRIREKESQMKKALPTDRRKGRNPRSTLLPSLKSRADAALPARLGLGTG
jgi:hypothetical protein